MIFTIDSYPIVSYSAQISVPEKDAIPHGNDPLVDQAVDQIEILFIQDHTVPNADFTVLWQGHNYSSLRPTLIKRLKAAGISVIVFLTEDQLLHWLNTNSITKVAALILEPNTHIQNSLSSNQIFRTIRSILIRCTTDQLIHLRRFSRTYRNIDGVYDDDIRVLIKLMLDLACFSEELGDQEREDRNNHREAQRHYDRALKLCEIAEKF